MGEKTGIAWTDHTFNTHWGCQVVSPACESCYAKAWSERVGHGKSLPVIWGGASTERRFFGDKHWAEPLKWNRDAEAEGRRHRVFSVSMGDIFEDRVDLDPVRDRLFELTLVTPWLDWQLLTKRTHLANRMWEVASGNRDVVWRDNVWMGTTCEDRKFGVPRIAHLRAIPAKVRFLSCEPLLEDLGDLDLTGIHWVISGGESGSNPRPYDLSWARRLRDQCAEKGVAYFFKQLGAHPMDGKLGWPLVHDKKHGSDLRDFPAGFDVREFPS